MREPFLASAIATFYAKYSQLEETILVTEVATNAALSLQWFVCLHWFHVLRDEFRLRPPGGAESYQLVDSRLQSLRCAHITCVYFLDVSFLYLGP